MIIFKRKNLRLKNFEYKQGYAYFITICAYEKQNLFEDPYIADLLQKELLIRNTNREINLYCYCIMPNHVHFLISLDNSYNKSLSVWISSFKRYTAKIAEEKLSVSKLWKRNYYDHVIRKEESLSKVADYILNNPVRKKIVTKWEDYPYCGLMPF